MISIYDASSDWDDSLFPHYLRIFEEHYRQSVKDGVDTPLLVGFDTTDDDAMELAIKHFGHDLVNTAKNQDEHDGKSLLIANMSKAQALLHLSYLPGFERFAEFTAQGRATVLIISAGQAQWISMPIPS